VSKIELEKAARAHPTVSAIQGLKSLKITQ
jgi:hypothetical protein